ncbi:amidohydrolase [Paenibacillus doosanensis]|uniref:M20 metallopeptidase family protein n=1 Tax=Paenibacillus doosanensis TaxID=1229154 RepID=UPI00217F29F2|nr:amidohydrolase [Paenibacillus doosanensis]MCS7462685.1 amidohydrolase [Paenibacillus doosanensis]
MSGEAILAYADTLEEELVAIRRDLHRHPELLYDVHRTAAKVAGLLEEWGLEVRRGVGRHFGMGVVGILRGRAEGRTVLLRADMDALPIQEENDAAYKSRHEGVMHACGHDAHTAMLLGAAKALSRFREELRGTVKFVFQPAEEGARPVPEDGRLLSGGRDMIEDGILEGVDAGYAFHVWPELPIGTVGVHRQYAMAASYHFTVQFHGVTGHHSTPHQAVDAIVMAAQFIGEIKVAMSTELDPMEPAVLSYGTLRAGSAHNAIADHAVLTGTFRAFDKETILRIVHALEHRAGAVAASFGGRSDVRLREGTPLRNDPRAVRQVQAAGAKVFGEANTLLLDAPSLAGEDFAWYLERIPGAFVFIGAGNAERGIVHPVHHPRFDVDERVLAYGAKLHIQLARQALEEDWTN